MLPQEVLENIAPDPGALSEAYHDAIYFKCGPQ